MARDLRLLVRERLKAGDSDSQMIDFMVARCGEFVLLEGGTLSARLSVIEPVQLIDCKCFVGKPSLRSQLVDEHLSKRSKACKLALFDKSEPCFHIRDRSAQAVIGKS